MAINILLNSILVSLREHNVIGKESTDSIFEIGEQNWYGDIKLNYFEYLIDQFVVTEEREGFLRNYEIIKNESKENIEVSFNITKFYYKIIFNYKIYRAIDMHGTKLSIKQDLNEPYLEDNKYKLVTNFGTTEHIFNQYQVFKTIHNLIKPNGLIMHFLPYQGAYNHGFYNYHPTFFFDLGKVNNYEIIGLWAATIINKFPKIFNIHNIDEYNLFLKEKTHPKECYIFTLFKNKNNLTKEFISPQQGVYFDDNFSNESKDLWDKYKTPNS